MNKKDFTLLLLAAGRGSRMGADKNKNLILLAKRPVIYYSLKAYENMAANIVIVTNPKDSDVVKSIVSECYIGNGKNTAYESIIYAKGGAERYNSVVNGLEAVTTKYVFIHDSARCLITEDVIKRCAEEVIKYDAAIAAVPTKDTIKISNAKGECPQIKETPNRSLLWSAQTPQTFKTELIKEAYKTVLGKASVNNLTDDAQAVEYIGHPVHLVKGSYTNIKITEPSDLKLAESILNP